MLDTGTMLLGRRTWQLFAGIWPGRDDPFSAKLNAMPKLVASRSLENAAGWQNSAVLRGDLVAEAGKRKQEQDIVVTGSVSVVRELMAHDLVDEYRLLVFPLVLGTGTRLFPDGTAPVNLVLGSAQTAGPLSASSTPGQITSNAATEKDRTWSPATNSAVISWVNTPTYGADPSTSG